tara:strand:+ start:5399 stop:6124 length:726 start_codon:yes stop_codon:yes gene_type:complete
MTKEKMAYIQNYFLNNKMRERLIFRSVQQVLESNQTWEEGSAEFTLLYQELESRWEYIREEVINGIYEKSKLFDELGGLYIPDVLNYIKRDLQDPSDILIMVPPHMEPMSQQQLMILNNPGVNFGHAAMTPEMIHSARDQYLIKCIISVWCRENEEYKKLSYSSDSKDREQFHEIMEAAPYPIETRSIFSVQPSPFIESVSSSTDPPPSSNRMAVRRTQNATFELDLKNEDARNQRLSLNL